MKTPFLKTNDRAFSNLLRAQIGRPSGSPSACPDFDADLANAYVEHSLTPAMHSRYERHLSECAGCRTSVVALARMAEADSTPIRVPDDTASRPGEPGWLGSIKGGFSSFASPRWTAAVAALVIIAFGIPVLVWQSGRFENVQSEPKGSLTAQERPQAAAPDSTANKALSGGTEGYDAVRQETGRANFQTRVPATRRHPSENPETATASVSGKDTNEQVAGQISQTAAEPPHRKVEVDRVAGTADESRSQARGERAAAASGQPPATRERSDESTVLSRISKDEALKLPAEDKRSVSVTDLRRGVIEVGPKTERERAATITPRDAEAPKTKGTEEGVARGSLAGRRGSRALLDGDSSPATRARSPQKKVGKKTFLLTKGIWTDSDYDPTGDLPIVTVIRSSDVYRELLEKNNKLKGFLTGFAEGERAIIVFKSTVYKLIPHSDSK